MRNVVDFFKDCNSNDIGLIAVKFFDEIMVLYNLVGDRTDLEICTDDSASIATFKILTESETDAVNLCECLNNMDFQVYGKSFYVTMNTEGNSVHTTITSK